jgi:hypothetical protein
MDNDEEMWMELLMQDKADAATKQEQRMMVLTAMLRYQEKLAPVPHWGGSRVGKAKNKNQQRLTRALCLTQIILRMMQQIPLRNYGVVFG